MEGSTAKRERRRMSLADEIAHGLRDLILSGEIVPGDRIGEMEIAQRFDTSQGPVREAFATLRQEGLLISFPRRGTFVSGIAEEDARATYEIRLLLEPYVIERALARITDQDIEAWAEDVRLMRVAGSEKNLGELIVRDMRFHGRFYELSGSSIAQSIWNLIELNVRKFIAIAGKQYFEEDELPAVAELHATNLELIRRRDVAALQEEIRRQLIVIWDRINAEATRKPDTPRKSLKREPGARSRVDR